MLTGAASSPWGPLVHGVAWIPSSQGSPQWQGFSGSTDGQVMGLGEVGQRPLDATGLGELVWGPRQPALKARHPAQQCPQACSLGCGDSELRTVRKVLGRELAQWALGVAGVRLAWV